MIDVIVDMLKGTPWYVFIIFGYLIWLGARCIRPYTMRLREIWLLPIALSAWMMISIFKYHHSFFALASFFVGMSLGILIWWLLPAQKFIIDRATRTITYEGSWTILPLLMSIFVVKYAFGYMHAIHHSFIEQYPYAELVATGCISGIFVARMLHVYYHYKFLTK